MRDPEFSLRIRFDAAALSLARVRAVVETLLVTESTHAFRQDEIDEILLGLQESLTNVARHAYPMRQSAIVELLVRTADGRFQARIKDRGRAFEPRPAPESEPLPRASGYGLLLMDRTMDRIAYRRRGNANVMRLERAARRRSGCAPIGADPEPISIKPRPVSNR